MAIQRKNIKKISKETYYKSFQIKSSLREKNTKLELALERAWHNRDFEIEKYWSRATYFWAFIAAAFAGYIAVMTSEKIKPGFQNELAFMVICMGIVFSSAWLMVNIGSKKWQENWEKHIDMLEDEVTGPLYKTVWNKRAFSVSKINIYVSGFVIGIWVLLGFAQLIGLPYDNLQPLCKLSPDFVMIITGVGTAGFVYMLYTKSNRPSQVDDTIRGMFSFERRAIHFDGPDKDLIDGED